MTKVEWLLWTTSFRLEAITLNLSTELDQSFYFSAELQNWCSCSSTIEHVILSHSCCLFVIVCVCVCVFWPLPEWSNSWNLRVLCCCAAGKSRHSGERVRRVPTDHHGGGRHFSNHNTSHQGNGFHRYSLYSGWNILMVWPPHKGFCLHRIIFLGEKLVLE